METPARLHLVGQHEQNLQPRPAANAPRAFAIFVANENLESEIKMRLDILNISFGDWVNRLVRDLERKRSVYLMGIWLKEPMAIISPYVAKRIYGGGWLDCDFRLPSMAFNTPETMVEILRHQRGERVVIKRWKEAIGTLTFASTLRDRLRELTPERN